MRLAIALLALVLAGCERPRSTEDVAEDVADATARDTARSVAGEVSAEQYREIDERLDRLESRHKVLLETDGYLLNEVGRLERNQDAADKWAKGHLERLYNGQPPPPAKR